ncbi:hypothetical protein [Nocardioides sp. Arc9.136]|uniref:hypothetical protein n=1 Tax=Nocardioides sp. Arc9.136 TaxID=2996826 RepID=UPI0026665A99|nr:hypothetical protein [Nocardioides sp. Arc9.136]WKN47116.1 hypothetical protein OSR43_13820 [Nocardioides sp. Arc9.136]
MSAYDWSCVALIAGAIVAMSIYVYVVDPARQERKHREQAEDQVALARATGVLSPDHTECHGGCGLVLCLDDVTCPGHAVTECTHHGLLCGDCRLADCTDCRLDAAHDAGVLG